MPLTNIKFSISLLLLLSLGQIILAKLPGGPTDSTVKIPGASPNSNFYEITPRHDFTWRTESHRIRFLRTFFFLLDDPDFLESNPRYKPLSSYIRSTLGAGSKHDITKFKEEILEKLTKYDGKRIASLSSSEKTELMNTIDNLNKGDVSAMAVEKKKMGFKEIGINHPGFDELFDNVEVAVDKYDGRYRTDFDITRPPLEGDDFLEKVIRAEAVKKGELHKLAAIDEQIKIARFLRNKPEIAEKVLHGWAPPRKALGYFSEKPLLLTEEGYKIWRQANREIPTEDIIEHNYRSLVPEAAANPKSTLLKSMGERSLDIGGLVGISLVANQLLDPQLTETEVSEKLTAIGMDVVGVSGVVGTVVSPARVALGKAAFAADMILHTDGLDGHEWLRYYKDSDPKVAGVRYEQYLKMSLEAQHYEANREHTKEYRQLMYATKPEIRGLACQQNSSKEITRISLKTRSLNQIDFAVEITKNSDKENVIELAKSPNRNLVTIGYNIKTGYICFEFPNVKKLLDEGKKSGETLANMKKYQLKECVPSARLNTFDFKSTNGQLISHEEVEEAIKTFSWIKGNSQKLEACCKKSKCQTIINGAPLAHEKPLTNSIPSQSKIADQEAQPQ
jgi:hypothetical protein